MNKFLLILFLFAIQVSQASEEECMHIVADGSSEIPFQVKVISNNLKPVSGAKVTIIKLIVNYYGDPFEELIEHSVTGLTNSEGVVVLKPLFEFFEVLKEDCSKYDGFSTHDSYLIIEKDNYFDYQVYLDDAKLERVSSGEKKLEGTLTVKLIPKNLRTYKEVMDSMKNK